MKTINIKKIKSENDKCGNLFRLKMFSIIFLFVYFLLFSVDVSEVLSSGFAGSGVFVSDGGGDQPAVVIKDSNYIYIGGHQDGGCLAGSTCWRVEKRDITTGALVSAFDLDGILQSDPTEGFDRITSMALDHSYLYIGGWQGSGCATGGNCWRVEKRDITTGALVSAFDSDGIVQSDPTSSSDNITSIVVDSSYIYLGGTQDTGSGCATGSFCWRVEKRDITTGALVGAFDSDGIVQSDPTSGVDQIISITIDSSYIYLGGYQDTGSGCATGNYCFRVEKRDITTGALVGAFDSDGIVQSDPTGLVDQITSIAIDSSYIYLGGYQATGSGCATGSTCWRLEKRDITTGALVSAFDSDGIVQSDPTSAVDQLLSIVIDSSYIYLGGYQATGSGCAIGGNCWRLEKRDITTGALVGAFDSDGIVQSDPTSSTDQITSIAIDSSYIYLGGYQSTGSGCVFGNNCWRVEKIDITTGALVGAFDSDGILQSDPTTGIDQITFIVIDPSYIYLGGYQISLGRLEKRDITTGALVSYITISGTLYSTDETTPITSGNVKLSIAGGTATTTPVDGSGNWSFRTLMPPPTAGQVVTVWTDGGSDRASLVFKYGTVCEGGALDCTGLKLYKYNVIIGVDYNNTLATTTNADLSACDNDTGTGCSDTDIGFTSNSGVLTTTWATNTLRIKDANAKFSPGGDITISGLKQSNGVFNSAGAAGWYDAAYAKRKSHVINGTANTGTNYQVKIIAYKATGTDSSGTVYLGTGIQNDFDDVRFTDNDGTTPLDFWIASTTSGVSAEFWVEVADTLESNATIYTYYQNASATSGSNGSNTFLFFDDFSGASLDLDKWTAYNVDSTSQSGGILSINNTNRDPSKVIADVNGTGQSGSNVAMRARYRITSGSNPDQRIGLSVKTDITNGQSYNYVMHDFTNKDERQFLDDTIAWGAANAESFASNTWYTEEIYHSGTAIFARFDDSTWYSWTRSGRSGYLGLNPGGYADVVSSDWDYAFIRKIVATEPTHSTWGAEEVPSTNINLYGPLTITGGTFTSTGGNLNFSGDVAQTITKSGGTVTLGPVIINKTNNSDTVTLASNLTLADTLTVTKGLFSQGASHNLTTGGVLTVSSNGTLSNIGTGDLTLGGNVSNAGTITMNSNNGTQYINGANDIAITSSSNGVQRTWSGAGTFTIYNAAVTDMLDSGITITAYNSTLSNSDWTAGGECAVSIYGGGGSSVESGSGGGTVQTGGGAGGGGGSSESSSGGGSLQSGSGTLAVHSSSPARVTSVNTTITTAPFDPPANSLILVMFSGDGGGVNNLTMTNSGTALTWTQEVIKDDTTGGRAGQIVIKWAVLSEARTGMTVTATRQSNNDLSMKVYVVNGYDQADPIGASGSGGTTTNNITPTVFTSTAANSMVFAVYNDYNATEAITTSSDLTVVHNYYVAAQMSGLAGYKTLGASGSTVTVNFDGGGTAIVESNWGAVEVKPGSGPVSQGGGGSSGGGSAAP